MKNIFTIQAPKAPSHVNAPKQQVDQYYDIIYNVENVNTNRFGHKSSESYN